MQTVLLLIIGIILLSVVCVIIFSKKQEKVSATDNRQAPTSQANVPEPSEKPFPLHDESATYRVEGNVVYYIASNGIRPIGIAISKDTQISLDEFDNQEVTLEGKFITEKKEVQCIKAPCSPVDMQVIHLDKLTIVTK